MAECAWLHAGTVPKTFRGLRTVRDSAAAKAAASRFVCQTEREIGKERSRRGGQVSTTLLLISANRQNAGGLSVPPHLLPSYAKYGQNPRARQYGSLAIRAINTFAGSG